MNRVKYVPANPTARALGERRILVVRVWQGARLTLLNHHRFARLKKLRPTVAQADEWAALRGWIRLAALPPSERRKYRRATAQVM